MRVIAACFSLILLIMVFSLISFSTVEAATPNAAANSPQGRPADNPEEALRLSPEQREAMHDAASQPKAAMHEGGMKQGHMMQPGMMHGMMRPGMTHMMEGASMSGSGTYSDRSYLSAMIAHHEAAVDMAMDALKNAKDAEVLTWAGQVVKTQDREITQMREWLKPLGGMDDKAAADMRESMHAMMSGGAGMDADHAFVAMMTDHHAGAVYMATEAILGSDNPDVIALSRSIAVTQLDEIIAYRQWLKKY